MDHARRSKLKSAAWVFVGTVYCIVASEFFLRWLAPVPMLPRYVTAAPYGIRCNEPCRQYWQTSADYRVQVRTNSRGIRADVEFSYAKPDDVRRVVVLGDSYAMGYEVDNEDNFLAQMERQLRAAGINAQVINLAVSGHGNAEELIVLQEEGLKYHPDLVLLCWHSSDYFDNVRSDLFRLSDGELVRHAETYLPGVAAQQRLANIPGYGWVSANSQFYWFFREWTAIHVAKPLLFTLKRLASDERPQERAVPPRDGLDESTRALALALIDGIHRCALDHGSGFLVLDVPNLESQTQFKSVFPWPPAGRLAGLPVVSPVAALHENEGKKLFWDRGHKHFTPLGCRIVGNVLAAHILQNRLLEP